MTININDPPLSTRDADNIGVNNRITHKHDKGLLEPNTIDHLKNIWYNDYINNRM